ncbi:hypothetical protein SK128_019673 [Halocaridina rubra]|uniref:Uncharacterized protein n=1 Tax=Halocaridina rubra TaxID=373956 RepID=A0AAN8X739_HALRR
MTIISMSWFTIIPTIVMTLNPVLLTLLSGKLVTQLKEKDPCPDHKELDIKPNFMMMKNKKKNPYLVNFPKRSEDFTTVMSSTLLHSFYDTSSFAEVDIPLGSGLKILYELLIFDFGDVEATSGTSATEGRIKDINNATQFTQEQRNSILIGRDLHYRQIKWKIQHAFADENKESRVPEIHPKKLSTHYQKSRSGGGDNC